MASKFTIHNGPESDSVNAPVDFTTGLKVGGLSFPSLSGNAWYVDASSTAGTGADGKTKASAFLTIASAITAADANDVIFVYAGTYAENLTVSDNYITLVGVQTGYGRPDIAPASGVALTVTGQGFSCSRCRFVSIGSTDGVKQNGNGFTYDDCVFDGDSQTGSAALVRLVGHATSTSKTASEGVISNCLFRNAVTKSLVFDSAPVAASGVGSTDNRIVGCKFTQNTLLDIETAKTGAGADYSVKFLQVESCSFADKNKATYIDITTNADGAAGNQSGTLLNCNFASDTMTTTVVKMVGTAFTATGINITTGIKDMSAID